MEVPSAGWVRAPLDLLAIQHMAPDGADLRVFSPAGAEIPARLEPSPPRLPGEVPGPSLEVATRDGRCEAEGPGALACLLTLPAPGQRVRRLSVEVEGKGMMGYRLYRPQGGRWRLLAEGVWQRGQPRTRHLLDAGPSPVPGGLLRLELHGSTPRLVSYGIELELPTVLFEAPEPGPYVVAYGAMAREEAGRSRSAAPAEAVWVTLGPEEEHAPPSLISLAAAPSLRLDERRLAGSWRVVAPGVKAGTLLRLELPGVVYRFTREDLGNLRLVAGDRQVPFFRWSPDAPALVVRKALGFQERGARRESEAEIRLPHSGLPLTALDLTAPAAPLRRPVGVRYLEPDRSRREEAPRDREPAVRGDWECRPRPPLPCRESLELPAGGPPELAIRLHDGDNPPLAGVQAALWRRNDTLLFVWPETERPVRLVAGPRRLEPPSYDLQALGDRLLRYPWEPAELDLEAASAGEAPWWSGWIRPMTLVIAGMCLLVLLRRILMEGE
ncbi:MAG TPA: hypothetical protein VG477_08080 [Thermoanaerobaculia bacterium]|nr:hypothetical protein [Thermoanaerobaculia bacterium]